MEKDLQIKYSRALQEVQRERNVLRAENEQLKQQLAESEKQRKHLKDWLDDEILTSVDHESYYATINEYEEEIKQLKQQLAEKEKEIEELRFTERNIFPLVENLEEKINQDKISFAVEQLEKVKELFLIESKKHPIVYDISDDIVGGAIDRDKCFQIIDNQIKQLKEGK